MLLITLGYIHERSNDSCYPANLIVKHVSGNNHISKLMVLVYYLGIKGLKFFSGFANVINAMRKCPKLIIARIQGKCVGGGVGLASAADYTIAMVNADIKLSELAIGIGPFVVGPAVERKIGNAPFTALAIDATMWRNSEWAKKKGLFAEVHENIENMDESIQRLSHNLAHSNPEAMAELKKISWKGTENWDTLLKEEP